MGRKSYQIGAWPVQTIRSPASPGAAAAQSAIQRSATAASCPPAKISGMWPRIQGTMPRDWNRYFSVR